MDRIFRFAIIGCGVVARKHIRAAYHNRGQVELVALSDLSSDAMKALVAGSKFSSADKGRIALYNDYVRMLDEQSPDIVAITTPSGTHFAIGMAAVSRGISILLEKPMTLVPDEAHALNEAAAAKGVKIALGHIYRYFPLVGILARDIAAGTFGKVLYGDVKVLWGHGQEYYDKAAWRGTWAQDGGVLMNQSIHALDLMNYLMGSHPVEAVAMLARQTHQMEAEDLGMGILKMEDGSYCTIAGTTSSDPSAPEASFYVLCTGGYLTAGIRSGKPFFNIVVKSEADGRLKKRNLHYLLRYLGETLSGYGWKWIPILGKPHSWILRDLCDSIRSDTAPRADGLSGESSLQSVIALYYAAKEKRAVRIPLDSSQSKTRFDMEL
ncbi:MAG: Gfo/Idh/MocA family protein [Saccharofermentanales bacterium]